MVQPGVFLAARPEAQQPSTILRGVCQLWGVDDHQSFFSAMAECSSLVTFMNPQTRGPDYVDKVLARGHTSVAGQSFVTLGLFGVPLETVIELLSHGLDTTARVTSSAVVSMDDPLFCVFGPEQVRSPQIAMIDEILAVRERQEASWRSAAEHLTPAVRRELRNSLWPSCRAVVLFMGMRLIDWQKLLSKRLPRDGNEAALRFVCWRICLTLRSHSDYARVIGTPEQYGGEEFRW